VPIPEELPVIAAGVVSREDLMLWWLALPACVLGVLSGDVMLYWAGRHWGDLVGEEVRQTERQRQPHEHGGGIDGQELPERDARDPGREEGSGPKTYRAPRAGLSPAWKFG
jgi:hypothetical protein